MTTATPERDANAAREIAIAHEIADEGCVEATFNGPRYDYAKIAAILSRHRSAREQRLEKALRFEYAILKMRTLNRTHYAGCEVDHPMCAAMQRIKAALSQL